jgi:hypothetical protein
MLVILFLIWIVALAIGIIVANIFKAKQSLGMGFLISIMLTLATLLFFPKILTLGKEDSSPPVAHSQPVLNVANEAEPYIPPIDKSPKNIVTAHKFAKDIYNKINEDNTYILDAYRHGEKDTLTKLTVTLPQRAIGTFNAYGDDPESTLAPYYACDNAYVELQSLLFDYSNDLTHNNADSRKQIRYRKARFDEQFAKCKLRVNMTPEQASADYQKEESKK